MNYFELFDFAVAPRIDKSLVAQKYFALQKNNHPDFFTQATEAEQEHALQQSAEINKAFAVFQDEDKTIEYFLQQKEVIQTDEKYQLPNEFLLEMMELNETLLEKDGVTLAKEMADIEKPLLDEILPVLEQAEPNYDTASLEKLKAYYYKKKYLKRILARLGD
ncbi:MAG: Fe-S protein assembly co-chaperone HscB [Gloeobacteraceae cyanobacterium ES-bin-316]|nr:Fe-S protein assembly co-chaperone HscB [Ferruginibacter sp.]